MRQLHLPLDLTSPLHELAEKRERLTQHERAKNTLKSYRHDWKMFQRWCDAHQLPALPATTENVALYLTDLISQDRKISTAIRRTSGITHAHKEAGFPTPITTAIWTLISCARRTKHELPYQVLPLRLHHLEEICAKLVKDSSRMAIRDRALITVGFSTALRRSSLCDLLTDDVAFVPDGMTVRVRFEKQDQEGHGRTIGVPFGKNPHTCPVASVHRWLEQRGPTHGNLFTRVDGGRDYLHSIVGATVLGRVRACVRLIGLDPKLYGGHSLRAGFITEAGCRGTGELLIAQHTGHRSMEVLRKYFRHNELFSSNVAGMIGL